MREDGSESGVRIWGADVAVIAELSIQPSLNHLLIPRHQQEGGGSPQDGGPGPSAGPQEQNDTSTGSVQAAAASGVA